MLSRNYRLKKEIDFKRVYHRGKYIRGFFFDISYLQNYGHSRFGIVVTTKSINKANKRNRAKRILHNLIAKNQNLWPKNVDIIVKIKKEIEKEKRKEAESELKSLLGRIR